MVTPLNILAILGILATTIVTQQDARSSSTSNCRPVGTRAPLRELPEASGVAAGRRTSGVLWAHNDSGDPVIFALDSHGAVKGHHELRVPVAQADIAAERQIMATVPTPKEFVETSRSEFRFLLDEFGFREAPCSVPQERFCVRFTNNDRSLEVRGEGWGTTAACHVFCGDKGPLSLIDLVPDACRPKRSRKRDRMGQLDHIREWARFAREHAKDFLGGDVSRFARIWDVHQREAARRREALRRMTDSGSS